MCYKNIKTIISILLATTIFSLTSCTTARVNNSSEPSGQPNINISDIFNDDEGDSQNNVGSNQNQGGTSNNNNNNNNNNNGDKNNGNSSSTDDKNDEVENNNVVTVNAKSDKELSGSCQDFSADVKFNNADIVSAAATISIKNNSEKCEYQIFWGDKGKKIDKYSALASVQIENGKEAEVKIHKSTAIPNTAKQMLIVGKNLTLALNLPDNKVSKTKKSYSFGCGSDFHVAYDKIGNGVQFLSQQGISAFFGAGDLTQNGTDEEFTYVYNRIKNNVGNIPFFSCGGNHDFGVSRSLMKEKFGVDNPNYFAKSLNGDIYVFISITALQQPFESGVLESLKYIINSNKDKRIFIFQHLFLVDTVSSIRNKNSGATIYPPSGLMKSNDPHDVAFRALVDENPNVFHFSGHSHWLYSTQQYDENANIYSKGENNGTYVHIGSMGDPLVTNGISSREHCDSSESEGMLVEVYKDYTVIIGVDLKNKEYLSYATYVVPFKK